jgi:hypothetical protein
VKRLTKDQWRAARVFNPHEIARLGGGKVFIGYRSRGDSRSCIVPGWMVHGIGFNVDPGGHWSDNGSMWFEGRNRPGNPGLQKAKDWAARRYGIDAWERDPFGGWHDAAAFERATAKARAVKP